MNFPILLGREDKADTPYHSFKEAPETLKTLVSCMAQDQELSGWCWANLESAKVISTAGTGVLVRPPK